MYQVQQDGNRQGDAPKYVQSVDPSRPIGQLHLVLEVLQWLDERDARPY